MPTIISHPVVIVALRSGFKLPSAIYFLGVICSVLPDLDVIGFRFGIQYGDLLGHRGLSHSLSFAMIVTGFVTWIFVGRFNNNRRLRFSIFAFLFICMASHGILDALTDGGLGVAFFSPFSNSRYFFPWRPLEVSPIGVDDFLTGPILKVLKSEFVFIWLPSGVLFVLISAAKRLKSPSEETRSSS